jgi:hypothetical protein
MPQPRVEDIALASTLWRRGLLGTALSQHPSPHEKAMLRQARHDVGRLTRRYRFRVPEEYNGLGDEDPQS